MSCNIANNGRTNINYENVGPYGNSSGSFASLDTAFSPSGPMNDFQNRMINKNPIFVQNVENDDANVDNNIQTLLRSYQADELKISPQSEEKIDNNVDQMIGALYNRDFEHNKQNTRSVNKQYLYPHIPVVQNGVNFPLNRQQNYSAQQYGTELLEDFNLQQEVQDIWANTDNTSYSLTGMSFFKFLLLLILIAVLVYGIYWLYTNNAKTQVITAANTVNTTTTTTTPTASASATRAFETLIRRW
ncbi:hypothetical protein QJ857_gp0116 [Tupanvirus soda lake]|uniref:Uncharacterized protein n=2 Tax=Tupanvirus TaxID=2094720 RepID=A0A6N1NUA4_9VIRU|nr:hypothetical protein QJ857_gp0116 [Tupanvirus soda lake]QKU35907.1 hypothetical protein [Tupanvirus soda lake]